MIKDRRLDEDLLMTFPSGGDMIKSFNKMVRIVPENRFYIPYIPSIEYGYLYNWYAVSDVRGIAPVGWHVATQDEWVALGSFIGAGAGDKLKESGSERWFPSVNNSTNDYLFDGRPGGFRTSSSGTFNDINSREYHWSSVQSSGSSAYSFQIFGSDLSTGPLSKSCGLSIRCVRDTGNTENEAVDIDGNVYESTTIGTQTWLRRNLSTTRYNNGELISKVTNNATWGSLLTSAYCVYNNNELNAFK
jgi:uncharacterized protein (TIGR02145 family)